MGDILKTEIIDTVELAKNLVQGIIKAKKVIKMYPANNPIYTKSIEDTYAKFKKFLDFYNTLFFRIHQNEILFNNEQVYYNSEKEDNLALFLFKDGVRDVTFLRGFDQNELEDFMKILNTDFENLALEDDIVTLLWERDFEHIKYTAADEFLYDEDHEKKYEEIKGSSCTEENLNRAYEDGLKAKAVDATPAIPITDDDLKRIEEYIENEETRPKIDKIIAIIFELLQQSKEEDILPEIAGFIEQTLAYCIRSGYFNKAVFVLDSLKPLLKENIGAENIKSLRRIYTTINSQPFIDELGAVLNSGTDIEEDGFAAFSKYLDKNTIALFIKLLGEISSIRGRRHIIGFSGA
ncbi:MAG: hypothetical protein HY758_04435 [Nitrospirae bacterium]|nr:hypothetical protein [Nitrospirota bacterium]